MSGLDPALQDLLERMLEKDPGRRITMKEAKVSSPNASLRVDTHLDNEERNESHGRVHAGAHRPLRGGHRPGRQRLLFRPLPLPKPLSIGGTMARP